MARHWVTYVDVVGLRHRALTEGKIDVEAIGRTFTLLLEPIVENPDLQILTLNETGHRVSMPPAHTLFEGRSVDGSVTATISLTSRWLRAHIVDGNISIYVEPKKSQGSEGPVETISYRDSDQRILVGVPGAEETAIDSQRPARESFFE